MPLLAKTEKMLKSVCQLYRDSFRYRFNQWFWASISPGSICCGKILLHSHFSIILFKLLLIKILLFISIFYCLCEYAVCCNYWLLIIFSSFILYVEMRLEIGKQIQIYFFLYHFNLKRKRNIILQQLAAVGESFIKHQAFKLKLYT